MITKKAIEKLPTVLRQNIYEHYNMCLDKAKADYEKLQMRMSLQVMKNIVVWH